MLPELGQILLILALLVSVLQTALPLAGAAKNKEDWMAVARPAAYAQFATLLAAFAILTHAFVVQDFSVAYVAKNSHSLLPMIYRYSAVWGSHEGSLLLWALVLAIWTAAVAYFSKTLPSAVIARVLGIMGIISIGFIAFLLFTSNPFERLIPAAIDGQDLNPLLQDPGLIIHPPMLYMGYVGFAVPFAFSMAALLEGKMDARWLRWTRPWTNIAWAFLTIGIGLGSWWAYYELGWGGWWFWDPVENASFMPWLVGTALLHSQAVTEKRGSFTGWTILLAIAAFSLSLLGTFLVRSGVLTSVHSFAADPSRGMFILVFLGLVIGGSLLLYMLRYPLLPQGATFAPASRETLLLINNLLFSSACAMVLLGTLYPLIADALNLGKISVGPPYFGRLFLLLMAPVVLLIPFGPLTRWQKEQPSRPFALLLPWGILALILGVVGYFMAPQNALKTAVGAAASVWVAFGTGRFILNRLKTPGRRFSPEMLGMISAHLGLAVFVAGALWVEALNIQREVALQPGQSLQAGSYRVQFDGVTAIQGPNYRAERGEIQVFRGERLVTTLHPEKRAYAAGGQIMTEAGIYAHLMGDVYVALGESLGKDSWAVRVHIKPYIRWVWLGALMMALGGLITATDKRFYRKSQE